MMRQRPTGFTIIELMLAMTFLSILLLAIAMLTMQMTDIYTRGSTLRQVNTVGSEISNDLQRGIQGSSSMTLAASDECDELPGNNNSFVLHAPGCKPTGGRLCLGSYSYVWNLGKALDEGDFYNRSANGGEAVRFAKVSDPGRNLCQQIDGQYDPVIPATATDMLADSDRNIVVQDLMIASERQGLFSILITIGTNDTEALTANRGECLPPENLQSDLGYCAVNQFDIVARTGV